MALSSIFFRASNLGKELLNICPSQGGYRYTSLVNDGCLPKGLYLQPSVNRNLMFDIFKQSTQANQAMIGMRPKSSHAYSFSFPRAAYANWILSQKYPLTNNWEEHSLGKGTSKFGVRDGVTLKGTKNVRQRLLELNEVYAGFFKINVVSTEYSYQSHSSFSAGSSSSRNWATIPEILELSSRSCLEMDDGFISKSGFLSVSDKLPLDVNEYSISRALLLENIWTGLCAPIQGSIPTSIGAYIRAYDRIACGRAANEISNNSFVVGSYSTGRVIVYLRESQKSLINETVAPLGLIPPIDIGRSLK